MVNDSKITVKLFLQERVKPLEHHGKDNYPVYAMVIFQRKNTQFSMNDFHGKAIFSTKEKFEEFNQDFERGGEVLKNWWNGHWRELLSKVLILEETVSICHKALGSRFSFKKVSQAFRAFEHSVLDVAYEWAFFKWLWFTKEDLELNNFLKNDWKDIHISPMKMRSWSDLTFSAKGMKDHQRVSIEAFVAYSAFVAFSRDKRRWGKETGGLEPPAAQGSVLSWVTGNEKHEFREFIENASIDLQSDWAIRGSGLNQEFVKLFTPKQELAGIYLSEINGAVMRNFEKNLEDVVKFTNMV